ncbi:FAD-dependent oxidoreductase [Microbacterium sp. H1-D42]|uniref:flavin monoamine oxidase family protein n=1 Tax=Microbacterium sp. H1-D42 TaxID=2925844 RepID=UPI001F537E63|nr:FAD-dependent oxidoreductase [Microbacterium sp. H1-D42]UNK70539.1 FAD-dependent oxidoreductase [Microbacterium sp. H1-D42]
MSITRRTLLVGAGTGAVAVLLAACTPEPEPKPTKTATPAPKPTAPANVPAPAGWARSTWSTDPYSFGAVSYVPAGSDPKRRETLGTPVMERVFFAGEATDSVHPGTVLGSIDSGRRAGMGVLAAASDSERIAVIGAGAAGVAAARTIGDAGLSVTLFEARERTGGRLLSTVDDDWPVPVQLGAWLISEEDVAALDDRLITISDKRIRLDSAVGWSAEGATDTVDGTPIIQAVERASGLPADLPITDALEQNGADPADPTLAAALAWLAATSGADPTLASSWYPPAFAPDALNGLTGDLSAFIEELLTEIDVTLASPVVRVAYDERGVSLRMGTGESLSFDRVIVTAPLGVLQQQGIEFAPALPFEHRGAIADLAPGYLETVWMRFDEPFWEAGETIWHVVGGDGLIRTWLNLQPVTGEPVLVGLVGGGAAAQFAALSSRDAKVAALASLTFFAPPLEPDQG